MKLIRPLHAKDALLGTDLDCVLEDFELTIDEREAVNPRSTGHVMTPEEKRRWRQRYEGDREEWP